MRIVDLLKDDILNLPKTWSTNNISFKRALSDLYHQYCTKLYELEDFEYTFENYGTLTSHDFKSANKNFAKKIIETIDSYYNGDPHEAYQKLRDVIQIKGISALLQKHTYTEEENFYRIRISGNELKHEEMFHIPFEKRGVVTTQRYSIPGFPSLYLSNSIYLCWEEMSRPDINVVHASRFTTLKRVKFLDFTLPQMYREEYEDNDEGNKKVLKYLMTWPLIAACSVKVRNRSDFFKPEYIIPQLILLWVRKTGEFDGIKYFSTHLDYVNTKSKGNFFNFVLPVKDNLEMGYCSNLINIFKFTDPLSRFGLYQFPNVNPLGSQEKLDKANRQIQRLSLFGTVASPYSSSIFAQYEAFLNEEYIKARTINNNAIIS